MSWLTLLISALALAAGLIFARVIQQRALTDVPAELKPSVQQRVAYANLAAAAVIIVLAFVRHGTSRFALFAAAVGVIVTAVFSLVNADTADSEEDLDLDAGAEA